MPQPLCAPTCRPPGPGRNLTDATCQGSMGGGEVQPRAQSRPRRVWNDSSGNKQNNLSVKEPLRPNSGLMLRAHQAKGQTRWGS